MLTGLHWDEPVCDGSQPMSGTWQCAQGKTLGQCFKQMNPNSFLQSYNVDIVDFKGHCNLRSSCGFPQEMNRPGEAIVHYQRASELQTQTPIEALLSMGDMATCKILTREYSLSFDTRCAPMHPCHMLILSLVWLFFLRGLRWCFVSVYRNAADVPGERTAVTRHQHTSWWEQWNKKWILTEKRKKKLKKCFCFLVYMLPGKLIFLFSFYLMFC